MCTIHTPVSPQKEFFIEMQGDRRWTTMNDCDLRYEKIKLQRPTATTTTILFFYRPTGYYLSDTGPYVRAKTHFSRLPGPGILWISERESLVACQSAWTVTLIHTHIYIVLCTPAACRHERSVIGSPHRAGWHDSSWIARYRLPGKREDDAKNNSTRVSSTSANCSWNFQD